MHKNFFLGERGTGLKLIFLPFSPVITEHNRPRQMVSSSVLAAFGQEESLTVPDHWPLVSSSAGAELTSLEGHGKAAE